MRTYWYSFEANHTTHQFKAKTTFEAVLNIYLFDRALRFHLVQALEAIEISLRTQFAYQFAQRHGPFAYADVAYSKIPHHFQINLKQLQDEISRSNEVFITHFNRKYTTSSMPPVWMACEVMSFGLLSRWYKNLKPNQVRKAIANIYEVDNRSLDGILHNFTELRNVIAHHGRLWDRNIIVRLPLPRNKPHNLRASMNVRQQDTLYNSLVMMLHFLDVIKPDDAWRQQLIQLIDQYQVATTAMGFPMNWRTLPVWKVN
jgi:abortive infection bacteriophage resistance protein